MKAPVLQRLNGVEPSHMPPEGIALSTELQTHSGLFKKSLRLLLNDLNYPSTNLFKSKALCFWICFSFTF